MDRVAVLLSAFNGEKYIRAQIDSILVQNDIEVWVFVRDDGSVDSTISILEEYEKKGKLTLSRGENLGPGNSFMALLYSAPDDFDYYAFADQDDVWLPNKLFEATTKLKESGALLYCSNQELVDADCNSMGVRYRDADCVNTSVEAIMMNNMCSGCTAVMTREMFGLLIDSAHRPSAELVRTRMHDAWVAAVAALYDRLYYDERAFILYRQHENNVVGARVRGIKLLFDRLRVLFHDEYKCGRSKIAAELTEKFPERMDVHPIIADCADARTRGGKKKVLRHRKMLRQFTKESALKLYLKIKLGFF